MNLGRKMLLRLLIATPRDVVAATCSVDVSTISRWAGGESLPRVRHRGPLEDRYGIPCGAWVESEADIGIEIPTAYL